MPQVKVTIDWDAVKLNDVGCACATVRCIMHATARPRHAPLVRRAQFIRQSGRRGAFTQRANTPAHDSGSLREESIAFPMPRAETAERAVAGAGRRAGGVTRRQEHRA